MLSADVIIIVLPVGVVAPRQLVTNSIVFKSSCSFRYKYTFNSYIVTFLECKFLYLKPNIVIATPYNKLHV